MTTNGFTAFFEQTRGSRGLVAACAALILALCAAGCATVAPYERERLTKPDMAAGRNPDAKAGIDHATAYREGTTGAVGSSGGGCGCN